MMSWDWLWGIWAIWLYLLLQYALSTQSIAVLIRTHRYDILFILISVCTGVYLLKFIQRNVGDSIMFKRKSQDVDKTVSDYSTADNHRQLQGKADYLDDDSDIIIKEIAPPKPESNAQHATVIPETCSINGQLNSTGDIHINGKIEGVIRSDKAVHILKNGRVEGDIYAQAIAVDGSLKGNCIGSKVTINANGFVQGIVQSKSLAIDGEGCFYGTSRPMDDDSGDLPATREPRQEPKVATLINPE